MKRFLIFLVVIVLTLVAFFLLANAFKAIGLYIALIVIATISLLVYSLFLFIALKIRGLSKLVQNCEYEKALSNIKYLKKLSHSFDEQKELSIWSVIIYSLLDKYTEAKEVFDTYIKKDMRTARLLNLYFASERLLYLCKKDKDLYKQSVDDFLSLTVNPSVILLNEMELGYQLINLSNGDLARVKVEDIKDNLDLDTKEPLIVSDFYQLFKTLTRINEDLKLDEDISFTTPLCNSLFNDLKTKILSRLTY